MYKKHYNISDQTTYVLRLHTPVHDNEAIILMSNLLVIITMHFLHG